MGVTLSVIKPPTRPNTPPHIVSVRTWPLSTGLPSARCAAIEPSPEPSAPAAPYTPATTNAEPPVAIITSAAKPETAPEIAPDMAAAFTFSPVTSARTAPNAAPVAAPIKVFKNSPSGSLLPIGLFLQYANILALRKPLTSVVAKVPFCFIQVQYHLSKEQILPSFQNMTEVLGKNHQLFHTPVYLCKSVCHKILHFPLCNPS